MFTQFFGNYLLNEKLISPEQLVDGLQEKANTRLKLGILAINAGYMTSDQVDRVHEMQTRIDRRFGDIAIELGYMTDSQVEELLKSQQIGYLLLGQALVDKSYISNSEFEESINNYKAKYSLTDEDIEMAKNEKIDEMISTFFDIPKKNKDLYTDYIELLINNLIRFIGDDFTILEPIGIEDSNKELFKVTQDIEGEDFNVNTSLFASRPVMIEFASRFIQEPLIDINEYTQASACDFINLHNGLFTVNTSNNKGIELKLTPPFFSKNRVDNEGKEIIVLPVFFTFGTVNFLISL